MKGNSCFGHASNGRIAVLPDWFELPSGGLYPIKCLDRIPHKSDTIQIANEILTYDHARYQGHLKPCIFATNIDPVTMNLNAAWFSLETQIVFAVSVLLCLLWALPKAMPVLRAHPLAVAVSLLLTVLWWSLRVAPDAGQLHGLVYHLLGITLAALMLGLPAAYCLTAVLMLPYLFLYSGTSGLMSWGIQVQLAAFAPLLLHALASRLLRRLPKNVFLYIFINGFLSAALGVLLTGVLAAVLLYAFGIFPADLLRQTVLPVFFFIAWGEAFLTGLLSAIFIALAPHLLTTFSEREYLAFQPQIWR